MKRSPSPPPIEWIPSDELLAELARRSDFMVAMTVTHRQGEAHSFRTRWKGPVFSCLGLLPFLQHTILSEAAQQQPSAPPPRPATAADSDSIDEDDFTAGIDDE